VIQLPEVYLDRVLRRVAAIWGSDAAAHHVVFGQSGAGKSTLVKALLSLCEHERAVIFDCKPASDPVWNGTPDNPHAWGRPVTELPARFGFEGERGGGPGGRWWRIEGSPDRGDTARRFGAALATIQAEGHCVVALDDVREVCRQLRLAEQVDSLMNLGRSASVLAILCATETGWVSGRHQGGMVWIGKTSGLEPAKAGAALLGHSGRHWYETTAAIAPHAWIFSEDQPGNAGPVLVRP
jgi:energy-coupling factor transporter ATP-binding protein EcfA2